MTKLLKKDIAFNKIKYFKKYTDHYLVKPEVKQILKEEKFGDRTPITAILSSDLEIRDSILNDIRESLDYYNLKKVSNVNKYIDNLLEFLGVEHRSVNEKVIGDVYCDHLEESDIVDIISIVESLMRIFPDNLLNKIGDVEIILSDKVSCSKALCSENTIIIECPKDYEVILITVRILHELTHLIEYSNPKLQERVVNFLLMRSDNKIKSLIQDIGDKYSKKYDSQFGETEVYRGKWDILHSGFVYEDVSKVTTELLTYSLELFVLNPIAMAYKDPELFEFIVRIVSDNSLRKYHNKY